MAERKVPAFISKRFHSLKTQEEKKKLLDDLVIWKEHNITKDYIVFLENQLQELMKEEEDKCDWLSVFHFKYNTAHNKGKRSVIRKLLKLFN